MTNTIPNKAKVMIGMVAVVSLSGCPRRCKLANPNLVPTGSSDDRGSAHLAAQGETARPDEHDVRQFARHPVGNHAARTARWPVRRI